MEENQGFEPPFTLGHENAGWIEELGSATRHSLRITPSSACCRSSRPTPPSSCSAWAGSATWRFNYCACSHPCGCRADVDDKKLHQAKSLGADDVVNNRNVEEAADRIRQITGPRGAGLVLDCVGVQPTVDLGAMLLGRNSIWTIVGLGGGHHDFHHGSTPYGTAMSIPHWGSRVELMEVIAMARNGRIHVETTDFPLEQAVDVYRRLKAGEISGRAVLIPHAA